MKKMNYLTIDISPFLYGMEEMSNLIKHGIKVEFYILKGLL